MGGVVKRGGVLLISKFVIGAAIGIVVGKVFGPTGVLGLSSLASSPPSRTPTAPSIWP